MASLKEFSAILKQWKRDNVSGYKYFEFVLAAVVGGVPNSLNDFVGRFYGTDMTFLSATSTNILVSLNKGDLVPQQNPLIDIDFVPFYEFRVRNLSGLANTIRLVANNNPLKVIK